MLVSTIQPSDELFLERTNNTACSRPTEEN